MDSGPRGFDRGDRDYGRGRADDSDTSWGRNTGGDRDSGRRGFGGDMRGPPTSMRGGYGDRSAFPSLQSTSADNGLGPDGGQEQTGEKKDKWDNLFNKGSASVPSSDRGFGSRDSYRSGDARRQSSGDDSFRQNQSRGGWGSTPPPPPTYDRDSNGSVSADVRGVTSEIAKAAISAREQQVAEEQQRVEAAKAVKAAKAVQRAEEERKQREEKEAAAAAKSAALQAEKEATEASRRRSIELRDSGVKGDALLQQIQQMEPKPDPVSLVAVLLEAIVDPCSGPSAAIKWCGKQEYGPALASLLGVDIKKQFLVLLEVQKYCNSLKFPKIEIKGEKRNLIEIIFQVLFSAEIIDHAGFMAWSDDSDYDDVPGKQSAIIQTTNFMVMLNDIDEDDEQEFDEEIDAVRETI